VTYGGETHRATVRFESKDWPYDVKVLAREWTSRSLALTPCEKTKRSEMHFRVGNHAALFSRRNFAHLAF
jgi:hypothetical protein